MEWILIGIIVLPGLAVIFLYNRLVALRQTRNNAFSDIDVQLKQRYDLVPQLMETVKGYAAHEKTLFENVTHARTRIREASPAGSDRQNAEGLLGTALFNMFAVAENYPALKADQNFQQLQTELSDIENRIAAARRFFNNSTSDYNMAVQQFPSNIIASMFGFREESFFELEDKLEQSVRARPEVLF